MGGSIERGEEGSRLRQIKGRRGRQEGWARPPRCIQGSLCASAEPGRAGAISHQACVTRAPPIDRGCLDPARSLAAEKLDGLALA